MLKIMRDKELKKKVIWFVAIIIIISFGFLGTAYLIAGNQGANIAGKIYGKKVSMEDFQKAYRHTTLQAQMRYGDKFSSVREFLNLENETWDFLILKKEIEKRKITVPDSEVVAKIQALPFFRKDEEFSPELYEAIISSIFRVTPRVFEESMRDILKIGKIFEQETAAFKLTDDEIKAIYKNENEKVQVSYVFIEPGQFKDEIQVADDEVKNYYEENKLSFIVPPTINVNYIRLPFPMIEDETASEPQVDKTAVQTQAEVVYQALRETKNIHDVAKQFGLDVLQSGFFSMEQPNLSLGWSYDHLNKLFVLEPNQITEPIETANEINIIQMVEKKDSYVPELSLIKDKIKNAAKIENAKKIAGNKSKELHMVIKNELDKTMVKDFPKVAKALNLNIDQTPFFNRGQYLPKIGLARDFQQAAFALTEDDPMSGVVEVPNGYAILYLDAYQEADMTAYETQKKDLEEKLSNERRNDAFAGFVNQLRQEANLMNNLTPPQGK